MPIYEYACETCGEDFEHLQRFTDAPLRECLCEKKGTVMRKLSLSAFQLKGGGWYKEGYGAPPPKAAADKSSAAKGEKSEKKGDSKTTDKGKKESATAIKNKSASA